nr:conjugal transfer protein MobB [Pedobacter sp. ASV2]
MIANIGRGKNLMGALSYNQLKVEKENGQILFTHNMIETVDGRFSVPTLMRSFEPYLLANNKTEKPVLHISINPDPKDQVTDEKFQAISQDYMHEMGYGNQPFVVFKHTDIDRTHIHIVSVCVDENGKKISDSFEKRRSMNVSRALEQKYGLVPMKEKDLNQNIGPFSPVDYKKGDIKSQLASVVRYLPKSYRFQTLGEYNALLSLFNITAEEVKGELHGKNKQGLVYFALNENGEKATHGFKASLFGLHASHSKIQEHLAQSKESLKKEMVVAQRVKKSIEGVMKTTSNETSFKKQLIAVGINTVLRRNGEGRIFGITFIDHSSKTVWNGSRVSKDLSANTFNEQWNSNQKLEVENIENKKTALQIETTDQQHGDAIHPIFDFISDNTPSFSPDETGFIEALGGLLPEALGNDFEELDFENQMKKRKRKHGSQK